MIEIKTKAIKDCEVTVPGSKSYTHRILIAAALSDGICDIQNILKSEDTLLTMNALKKIGVKIDDYGKKVVIHGTSGSLKPCDEPIYLANSGTSMRLLTGVATIGKGVYTLTGTDRMCERPIQDLLDGLNQIGVLARSINNTGCPPVEIVGDKIKGGPLTLQCSLSSQFLSSIMLIAPYTQKGLEIKVASELVSKPYVDMTVDIMERLGVSVVRDRYLSFQISGNQVYKAGEYEVEPDCSQASYFWAAAAVTGKKIKVRGISKDSRQGDVHFAKVLESMGCAVIYDDDGIAVMGKELSAVQVDMSDMPDIVPSLAVVAAFAKGTTVIKNVAHLKEKECDRLGSVVAELIKIGIDARATDTGMIITGKKPNDIKIKKVAIETYNDHRMAMSFAVAGLVLPGIVIKDENCVEKSFPNYWEVFKGMY